MHNHFEIFDNEIGNFIGYSNLLNHVYWMYERTFSNMDYIQVVNYLWNIFYSL